MSETLQVGTEEFEIEQAAEVQPKYHLTITEFIKTQEGKAIIAEQKPFVLEGRIWQGYLGTVVQVADKQVTDEEIERMRDCDGSIGKVKERCAASATQRRLAKQAELAKRQQVRDDEELRQLQLAKMRAEMGGAASTPSSPVAVSPESVSDKSKAAPSSERVECVCGKLSPPDHKSPDRWLIGHHMTCKEWKQAKAV